MDFLDDFLTEAQCEEVTTFDLFDTVKATAVSTEEIPF